MAHCVPAAAQDVRHVDGKAAAFLRAGQFRYRGVLLLVILFVVLVGGIGGRHLRT